MLSWGDFIFFSQFRKHPTLQSFSTQVEEEVQCLKEIITKREEIKTMQVEKLLAYIFMLVCW